MWSVLGGKLGAKHGGSTSIIFNEPETLEQLEQQRDLGRQVASGRAQQENVHFVQEMLPQDIDEPPDEPDTWQGSCLSFVTGQEELPENSISVEMPQHSVYATPSTSGERRHSQLSKGSFKSLSESKKPDVKPERTKSSKSKPSLTPQASSEQPPQQSKNPSPSTTRRKDTQQQPPA